MIWDRCRRCNDPLTQYAVCSFPSSNYKDGYNFGLCKDCELIFILESSNEELNKKIDSLESEVENLKQKIKDLKRQNGILTNKIVEAII